MKPMSGYFRLIFSVLLVPLLLTGNGFAAASAHPAFDASDHPAREAPGATWQDSEATCAGPALRASEAVWQDSDAASAGPALRASEAAWQDSEAALLLSLYVQQESVSGNELDAGVFFAAKCLELGLHVRIFTTDTNSFNFAASLYPLQEGKPNVIFLNHIDVVPAGDQEAWTHSPFSGTIADGYVWGRGSIDNKALGVMQLLGLSAFVDLAAESDLPYNFTMLSVSGEETGGETGAARMVEEFLDVLNPVVVFGEGGTGIAGLIESKPDKPFFGISVAHKGGIWFMLESDTPTSGHGSVPPKVYPTRELALASAALINARQPTRLTPPVREMFRNLGREERGFRGLVLRNFRFFRPFLGGYLRRDPVINALLSNTVTLTNFGGSDGAYNQIAHNTWATFDSRLLPGNDGEDFMRRLEQEISGHDVRLRVITQSPQAPMSEKGLYYHALEEAVLLVYGDVVVSPILFPARNDNSFFRKHGIPAYGLLPVLMEVGEIESIHNVDERMPIIGLEKGIQVYEALIRSLIDR
jgi:carboxypeptidase PM20D1